MEESNAEKITYFTCALAHLGVISWNYEVALYLDLWSYWYENEV